MSGFSKGIVFLMVYIDDVLVVGNMEMEATHFMLNFKKKFKVKEQKHFSKLLGIAISHSRNTLKLEDQQMIDRMLKLSTCKFAIRWHVISPWVLIFTWFLIFTSILTCKFAIRWRVIFPLGSDIHLVSNIHFTESNNFPNNTTSYEQQIGSLLHLSCTTRPDVLNNHGCHCRIIHTPAKSLWNTAKVV